ncbi:MAG: bifunctional nuclease domain-containing protein, partial [Actinomycetota bacterium]
PSDAIALAVRMSVPIFAQEDVLAEASILIPGDEEEEVEKFREFLDNVRPEDFDG